MTAAIKETLLSRAPQVFLMCCDFRNFSTVASALGLTQSAVSKIIANFENDLGFPLFLNFPEKLHSSAMRPAGRS